MEKRKTLKGRQRTELLDALYAKYGIESDVQHQWTYWRKKYAWLFVTGSAKFIKRFLDVVIALCLLLFFSPLMLVIALLIKIQDNGPIFYVSNRVGKWGKEFKFYKFRTMCADADRLKETLLAFSEYKDDVTFKMRSDPRITYLGHFLRKTSLDELPQLWNVLNSDISLVGPRPHLPQEVAQYTIAERRRLDVKPGITCIWQVSGRSEIPFNKQVKLDLEYIESQSFWLDIKLLLLTIPAVVLGKGAF